MTAVTDTTHRSYALITGASAGLGAEVAKQLAAKGKNLILVARREDRLRELADALGQQYSIRTQIIVADLSEPDAGRDIAESCIAADWQVDWLINNAGIAGPDLLVDRDWRAQRAT